MDREEAERLAEHIRTEAGKVIVVVEIKPLGLSNLFPILLWYAKERIHWRLAFPTGKPG